MNVTIGIILCLAALVLLQHNQWIFGLAAFALGILIMNRKKDDEN